MKGTKAMLTPADIAPLLGVSRNRVYQLIASGGLPAVRRGRAVRIPRQAWERWLEHESRAAMQALSSGKVRQ